MIFDYGKNIWESEKERNLYYKFFAGYFFNEMVDGYQNRFVNFLSLINNLQCDDSIQNRVFGERISELKFSPNSTHVTFDFHTYLLVDKVNDKKDQGELADILIHDRINRSLIAIEVKHFSNLKTQKDVQTNNERLKEVQNKLDVNITQCLLVNERKWLEMIRHQNQQGSEYIKFMNWVNENQESTINVLFWQDFLPIVDSPFIHNYLEEHIGRDKQAYNQLE